MLIISISLVILLLLIFAGLVVFLRKTLNTNLTGATQHLEELSLAYEKKEEELQKRQEEIKKQGQEIIMKARADTEQEKDRVLKDAQKEKDRIINEAYKKSDEIMQQVERARQSILSELDKKIEEKAIEFAPVLLQRTLPERVKQEIHERWFDELIRAMFGELERLHVPAEVSEAKVSSAFALRQEQVSAIQGKINEKLGRHINLTQEIDDKIIVGVIINMGNLVFDGSLRLKIQEASRAK